MSSEYQVLNSDYDYYDLEPRTHQKNDKAFLEYFICCPRQYDLNLQQIRQFNILKTQVNIAFNNSKEDHNIIVKKLYFQIFKKQIEEIPNENWKIIGFQNTDPRSDFRGGGLQSLIDFYEFQQHNDVLDICKNENNILLAITSINITFFLKQLFHLENSLHLKLHKKIYCSRKSFKKFCSILVDNDNLFTNIQNLLLKLTVKSWLRYKEINPQALITDVQIVVNRIQKKFKKFFNKLKFDNFDQLEQIFLHQDFN